MGLPLQEVQGSGSNMCRQSQKAAQRGAHLEWWIWKREQGVHNGVPNVTLQLHLFTVDIVTPAYLCWTSPAPEKTAKHDFSDT